LNVFLLSPVFFLNIKTKGEKEMEIHSEKKSKPVRSFSFWWIAGGIAVVFLLLWVWKKIKIFP